MNSVLLSVGVAVVLAMFAALLGPFLIDWNAYKYLLEARLSEVAGEPVSVGEVVELRLLPTPVLKANGLRVYAYGGEDAMPLLTAPRIQARMALAPILSGKIEFDELIIEEPALQVLWRSDGSVELPGFGAASSSIDPRRVSLNALEIREGSITIRDEHMREVRTLTGFNLTGGAPSLSGPFKAAGGVIDDGVLYAFRLATGQVQEDGALRTKLAVQPASGEFELALDGLLSASEGQPEFRGEAWLQRVTAAVSEDVPQAYRAERAGAPWRATMEIEATPLAVTAKTLSIGIGEDERAVQLAGGGRIDLYPILRFDAEMRASQIDLDRALGHGPGGRAAVGELGAVASGLETWIKALNAPLALRLAADAVLINGSLAEDLDVAADVAEARVSVKNFSVRLPGKSVLTGKGTVALGDAAPSLDATTQLETLQAGLLLQWLGIEDFSVGTLRVRPGAAAIVAKARLGLRDGVFRLDDLEAHLDDTAIAGRVLYQGGEGASRKLDLVLALDALDLDRYFEIVPRTAGEAGAEEAGQGRPPPDIALRLDAESLSLGDVTGRALVADLVYSQGSLTVNSLSLGNLGGTSLAASGRVDDVFGRADGELIASMTSDDLTGVARLATELGFTGRDGAELAAQAAAISPAAVEATLKAIRSDAGTEVEATFSAALGGTLAKTEASFRGQLSDLRAGTFEVSAEASNPDGEKLLAQLGIPPGANGAEEKLPGRVLLKLAGPLAEGAKLSAEAGFLGVTGQMDGTLTIDSGTAFAGSIEAATEDARVLLRRLDAPGKDAELPVKAEISGTLERQGARWRLHDIDGKTGRQTFIGDLRLELPAEGGRRLEGNLDLDMLSLPWLLATLLGAESSEPVPGAWPEAPFDLATTWLFEGTVGVSTNRLELPGGALMGGVRFDLQLQPGSAALNNLQGRLFGGEATANLRLADSVLQRGVTFTADISLEDAVLDELAWAPGGTPVATGSIDLSTRVNGSGRSWLGLVSSLGGEGKISARNGVLRGLDPNAFVEIVKAADSGLELKEDRVLNVFQGYLAAGALAYDSFDGVFEVNEGIVSAKNMALESKDASLVASTLVDLHQLKLDSEWTLTPAATEKLAAVPPVTLVFAGPLAGPQRQLDVGALTGYLTVRRLEEDVRRLEAAQADAVERERFDRILMQQTHEHMRRAREKRENARIAAERLRTQHLMRVQAETVRRQAAREQAARLEAERRARLHEEAAEREAARREAARLQAAKAEAEQILRERREAARLEAERIARERREAERLQEAERIARVRREAARLEAERIAREGREAAEREAARREAARRQDSTLEAERMARQRQAARAEAAAVESELKIAPTAQESGQKPLDQRLREALRKSLGSEPPVAPDGSGPLIVNTPPVPSVDVPDNGRSAPPPETTGPLILTTPVLPPDLRDEPPGLAPWPPLSAPPSQRFPDPGRPRSGNIDLPFDPVDPGG